MDPFTGLDVQIISTGNELPLYPDPDEEPHKDLFKRQCYVQATTGAIFSVKVVLKTDFPLCTLGPNDAVRITILYDNQNMSWFTDHPTDEFYSFLRIRKPVEYLSKSIPNFDFTSQQWKSGLTCFGKLEAKESVDSKLTSSDLNNLGRIQITIQRVLRETMKVPVPATKISLEPTVEVSEKLLKGKAITNTIRTSNEVVIRELPAHHFEITPMSGIHGQPLTINIFYRSKTTLQMLGCIPRSPSPEAPSLSDNNNNSTSPEQELQNLRARARIAHLENVNANIKREATYRGRKPVKREFKEDEEEEDVDDDDVTVTSETDDARRKRSRISGPVVETVDLTND